jgi:periplasmic protein TonB
MGYQALLFCPDEKTARSVTQVLSELEFTVVPCSEPFGAVKKLMAEHFDAVVVDCDNEQNATLLFKSARNTPNNQASLAVAVVEGQAGVAKAFRIGANLVLTKPINVEQAKGTLRVARGLLRKGEAAKPAAPSPAAAVKPATPAPTPSRPVLQAPNTRVVAARPAPPVKPLVKTATASIPTQKPPQPRVVAPVPTEIRESDAEILDVSDEVASPSIQPPGLSPTASIGLSPASSAGFGSGAASAPAPARELKPSAAAEQESSTVLPETESSVGKVADLGNETSSSGGTSAAPAASFTFGGNVSSDGKPASGGSKKKLLVVAAVVLIAAVGYAVWMQWVRSSGAATPFTHVAAPPVTTPAAVPKVAPSASPRGASAAASGTSTAAPSVGSSATSSATSSVPSSTPDSAAGPQPTGAAKTSSDSDAPDAGNDEDEPAHPSKVNPKADSAKPSAPAPSKVPSTKAAAPAIVIKNTLSQPAAKPAATPDAPAPSITGIAPGDNGGSLPNLMGGDSQTPAPVLQTLNVSQGVSQGLLVKKAQPVYPASALRMHVEGTVELLATVSKSGDISAVKILSGDPSLARAAVEAVKQWKYKPYLLNGEPIEIQTQVTMNFKLPK